MGLQKHHTEGWVFKGLFPFGDYKAAWAKCMDFCFQPDPSTGHLCVKLRLSEHRAEALIALHGTYHSEHSQVTVLVIPCPSFLWLYEGEPICHVEDTKLGP